MKTTCVKRMMRAGAMWCNSELVTVMKEMKHKENVRPSDIPGR